MRCTPPNQLGVSGTRWSERRSLTTGGSLHAGQVHGGRRALPQADAELIVAQCLRADGHPYERDARLDAAA